MLLITDAIIIYVFAMDQILLTTDVIIIYVLNPLIVFDKFLLNSLDDILFVYNPRLFHSLDMLIKSLQWTNCCLLSKLNLLPSLNHDCFMVFI